MITLEEVKQNSEVKALIKAAQEQVDALGFTEHSYRHINIVAERCGQILQALGYDDRTVELGRIAGFF